MRKKKVEKPIVVKKSGADKAVDEKPSRRKRTTVADIRKELEAVKETNMSLLNEIGKLSALYLSALRENRSAGRRESEYKNGSKERDAVVMATKRIIAFLMQTYGFTIQDLTK